MRVVAIVVLSAVMLWATTDVYAAREARSISFPAVSADGETVYFTCWGDIWSAPRDGRTPARRLTDNVALEARPVPSPDGEQLLFVSDRFGDYDLFVMPADGGEARRLTWDFATDYPYDWRSDGQAVLEYAPRYELFWASAVYEVPLDGSQPRRITGPDHDDHVFASYLGDDEHIVYTRGPGEWAQKHYHGQGNYDLWSYDKTTGQHQQLTDYDGDDYWPQPSPDGSVVYFVSDRDGTDNLWALDMESGEFTQLTFAEVDGPHWPRISSDGDEIAYEQLGELYIVPTAGGAPEKVAIHFADDPKHEMALDFDLPNNIGEYAVSPNGNYYAAAIYGDVFILKNPDVYPEGEEPDQDLARTHCVVHTPAGREMHLAWHPQSTKLAYLSDRNGQFDVYLYDLATGEEKQITDTGADEWSPQFAPHGEKLAYYSGNRHLMLYDLETEEETLLHEGKLKNGPYPLGYEWSPDGLWIAYVESILDYIADVFIINLEDREPVNVSFSEDWNSGPAWSSDGKYFAYYQYGDNGSDVMLLELAPEGRTYDTELLFPEDQPAEEAGEAEEEAPEEEPAEAEAEEAIAEETAEAADEAEAEDGEAEEAEAEEGEAEAEDEEEEVEPIEIDLDRIHLRAESVTPMQGDAYEPMFDPDSSYILFFTEHEGEMEAWTVTIEDRELAMLVSVEDAEDPQFAPDGSRIYFVERGTLSYLEMAGPQVAGGGIVPLVSRLDLDQFLLWEQMLKEGWRHLRDSFYDPEMHGVDWDEVLARYLPRVRECGTVYEYGRLYREMLGELAASHLGFYNYGDETEAPPEMTAQLGVEYDDGFAGPGWRVSRVVTDGPADLPGSELYAGDVILAVNGEEIEAGANRARMLANLAHQPVTLTVKSGEEALAAWAEQAAKEAEAEDTEESEEEGDNGDADEEPAEPEEPPAERDVVLMPVTYFEMLTPRYEQWVDDNRAMVDELSGGRVGYQHILQMDTQELYRFRRELFTINRDKEAVIIDVRFNGGGGISEELVEIIDRRPFAWHQVRGAQRHVQPTLLWNKPIVVLINSHSFSDAEIFPTIMQDLGLATLVGEDTGGGVIGTYDFPLLDGSILRLPAWGWWQLDGTCMERNGAKADVFVTIDPQAVAEGRDNQIEAAVDFLLKELE